VHHQQRDSIRLDQNPTEPPLDISYRPAARHKAILAAFLNALHESRRLQARRIVHQYEHLIAHPKERIPHALNQNSRGREKLVHGGPAQAKLGRLPAPSEMGWLVAVAVGFIIVHIVAGTIWLRASANETATSRHEPTSSLYD
jgi:hypothetical protein